MTFWDFANSSPVPALIMVIFVVMLLRSVSKSIAWTIRRWIRSRDLRALGWPTAPIDADGDVVPSVSSDDVAEAVVEKLSEHFEQHGYVKSEPYRGPIRPPPPPSHNH